MGEKGHLGTGLGMVPTRTRSSLQPRANEALTIRACSSLQPHLHLPTCPGIPTCPQS